jgi:predicted phage tail protein
MNTDFRNNTSESRSSRAVTAENESTVGLLRRVMDEASTLVRQEFALATAEIKASTRKLLVGAGSVAMGGVVLFAGFIGLLAAAILALALVLSAWLAALIVGGVVVFIGAVMLYGGIKKLEPSKLTPELTRESLKRDKELLTGKKP